MSFLRPGFLVLCVFAAACGKSAPITVNEGGPCLTSVDCSAPLICLDGRCVDDPRRLCEVDETRCNGNEQELCVDDEILGTHWVADKTCPAGCFNGQCRVPACAPNTYKCEPSTSGGATNSVISRCLSDGSSWETYQLCATSCTVDNGGASASCDERSCDPFSTRCFSESRDALETCNATGTAWVRSTCAPAAEGAEAVCVSGRCLDTVCEVTRDEEGVIVAREQRCFEGAAQQCSDSGTRFENTRVCDAGCDFVDGVASCAERICTPSATRCVDFGNIETCNARGTAWETRSCSGTAGEGRCVAGACQPKACSVVRDGDSITSRDLRCDGNARQQCNDTESGWTTVEVCSFGCELAGDPAAPSCRQPVCTPGEQKCQQGAVVECADDRLGFDFVTYCAAGCVANLTTSPPTAGCRDTMCNPLDRRCGFEATSDTWFVEVCHADGSTYSVLDECAQGCSNGTCTVTEAACTPGDVRCTGSEVEVCTQVENNATEWRFSELCLGECANGACVGGACGCATGDEALACGTQARAPVTLTALVPEGSRIPCDNQSRVLMATNVITDSDGLEVPDGTMVTFSHETLTTEANTNRPGADYQQFALPTADSGLCRTACALDSRCVAWTYARPEVTGADPMCSLKTAASSAESSDCCTSGTRLGGATNLVASADADPTQAGVQRPTRNGRALVLVRAPSSCAGEELVRVTGSAGGRCDGAGELVFANPAPTTPPSKTVWVAEDFSSHENHDRALTTALWDTHRGARGLTPFDYGTGRDGEFIASEYDPDDDQVVELDTLGRAAVYDVATIGADRVSTVTGPTRLSVGDEVLLINVYGPSDVRGTYEFKTVKRVEPGAVVVFEQPVTGVYSANLGANSDLSGHRVVLQRVPHFSTVIVETNYTLTMSPMTHSAGLPTGGSGVLAFRVNNDLRLSGRLSMDARGMAPGTTNPGRATASASLDRLIVGESTGGSGGGVVYVHAPRITFSDGEHYADEDAETEAEIASDIRSNPVGAGYAGSIWLAAGELDFGAMRRVVGGSAAQVRLDFGAADAAASVLAQPDPYVGLGGSYRVRSLVSFAEPTGGAVPFSIKSLDLTGLVGGSSTSQLMTPASVSGGLAEIEPRLSVRVSADAGASFSSADEGGAVFLSTGDGGKIGRQFLWEASLVPTAEWPLSLRGIAFRLSLN